MFWNRKYNIDIEDLERHFPDICVSEQPKIVNKTYVEPAKGR